MEITGSLPPGQKKGLDAQGARRLALTLPASSRQAVRQSRTARSTRAALAAGPPPPCTILLVLRCRAFRRRRPSLALRQPDSVSSGWAWSFLGQLNALAVGIPEEIQVGGKMHVGRQHIGFCFFAHP